MTIQEIDRSIKDNLDMAEELDIVIRFKYIELSDYVSKQRGHYKMTLLNYKEKCKILEGMNEKSKS